VPNVHHSVHTGRSLLSVESDSETDQTQNTAADATLSVTEHRRLTGSRRNGERSLFQDVTELMLSRRLEGSGFAGRRLCPTFFNSTESLR
jgi:hypothetical protein